jgi:enamine deaminase RidA (YjgF/YER057c/UK114 family)
VPPLHFPAFRAAVAPTAHHERLLPWPGNIVKLTSFVTDTRHRAAFRVVRDEVFGRKGPASTMGQVVALAYPECMIEVEAIAVL